ncbi:uncharacterized protein LOC115890969 isoform X2 [Sitophilus oryzae]|uniref:Uncharacterized protein LOC115890969 isoform X2 n=1 Tax=Sitophilus oryzae TaxID=7048 RepID=A0A6J2YV90_SITOR|nr:uncharacterized protein LOC115890969 isoform X2 [Sitophilus oryzae]
MILIPAKELRDRDHRTMRVNLRVGKRFGESGYDEDEAPRRRMLPRLRTGKRFYHTEHLTPTTLPQNTDTDFDKTPLELIKVINKREIHNPKRRLRLVVRPGKRSFENQDPLQYYNDRRDENMQDIKRSTEFLLRPRVGKLDKNFQMRSVDKRNDPKATDLWFGPRIGRSSDETFEGIPWNYVIFNANNIPKTPMFKGSNDLEEPLNDETVE